MNKDDACEFTVANSQRQRGSPAIVTRHSVSAAGGAL